MNRKGVGNPDWRHMTMNAWKRDIESMDKGELEHNLKVLEEQRSELQERLQSYSYIHLASSKITYAKLYANDYKDFNSWGRLTQMIKNRLETAPELNNEENKADSKEQHTGFSMSPMTDSSVPTSALGSPAVALATPNINSSKTLTQSPTPALEPSLTEAASTMRHIAPNQKEGCINQA